MSDYQDDELDAAWAQVRAFIEGGEAADKLAAGMDLPRFNPLNRAFFGAPEPPLPWWRRLARRLRWWTS